MGLQSVDFQGAEERSRRERGGEEVRTGRKECFWRGYEKGEDEQTRREMEKGRGEERGGAEAERSEEGWIGRDA